MTAGRILRTKSAKARAQANEELQETKPKRKPATVAQGKRSTTSAYRVRGEKDYGSEETQEENVGSKRFPPGVEPAFVRVAVGNTYNMLNYESLRIDVSVTLPCLPEDIDETYIEASEFVAEKLGEEEANWMGTKR